MKQKLRSSKSKDELKQVIRTYLESDPKNLQNLCKGGKRHGN